MDFKKAREKLIADLDPEIEDKRVLSAIGRVPREKFVPERYREAAYEDGPLPIGCEQTISQPYIIALMTQALELEGSERVLEIGTGSGYQTAILAELVKKVISVERISALAETARKLLDNLGYTNIDIHAAGESLGWKPGAPYDAIIVTAAAPAIPDELLEQLKIDGKMVIPVGSRWIQELCKVSKAKIENRIQKLGGCRFVSLIGKGAWDN
jgi:protein-L-isoaspartate(D-aspartate) O-methyltransferase